MINQDVSIILIIALVLLALFVASMFIPFYGFMRKRWKGLAIGCLIQPITFIACSVIISLGFTLHEKMAMRKQYKAAMVTLKKTDKEGNAHYWYLKTNDECLYEYIDKDENKEDDEDNESRHRRPKITKLFDGLPQDSFSVCVDDVIVVKFDLKKQTVKATEYDEPMEVAKVDWEKVNEYFKTSTTR